MIHYHGTPLSGDIQTAIRALKGKHACISFFCDKQIEIAAEQCQSFILDNGAFSFWNLDGSGLDIDGYMPWSEKWLKRQNCAWAIAPDIIDGTEEENDSLLELVSDKKHQYAPVFHIHESLDRLERLCNEWPRVCLGSSGEYSKIGNTRWWGRMADVMAVCSDDDGYPITKLHGLRMLSSTLISRLPMESADSTNCARNIGIDQAWRGTYQPKTKEARAMILMENIESHPVASRWNDDGAGCNMELFG